MADDLGARLVQAGLITREQLARVLGASPKHEGALASGLVDAGLNPEALAGFFVASGFGPLMEAVDLANAEPLAAAKIRGEMALELLALPIYDSPAGLVVAMASPTDRHAVSEIGRAAASQVLPTAARVTELRAALALAYPDVPVPAERARRDSDPPILELVKVRRRPEEEEEVGQHGYLGSTRGAARVEALATVGATVSADGDDFVPLVRTKPVTPKPAVMATAPVAATSVARAPVAAPVPTSLASPVRAPTAAAPEPVQPQGFRKKIITKNFERPTPAPAAASSPPPESAAWTKGPSSSAPVGRPLARLELKKHAPTLAGVTEVTEPRSTPPPEVITLEIDMDTEDELDADPTRPRSIIPVDHDSWNDTSPANKVSADKLRSLSERPTRPSRPPPIGGTLAAIRASKQRDEVVELACQGALTVARAAVLLALRKGVLKGWDGAGASLSRDAVRNLWIPTNSPSMFREVVSRRQPFLGPPGGSAADGLFRAALGSRGGDVALLPVMVGGKLVGVFAADDLRHGHEGTERVEILARAIGEAFERIIVRKKH